MNCIQTLATTISNLLLHIQVEIRMNLAKSKPTPQNQNCKYRKQCDRRAEVQNWSEWSFVRWGTFIGYNRSLYVKLRLVGFSADGNPTFPDGESSTPNLATPIMVSMASKRMALTKIKERLIGWSFYLKIQLHERRASTFRRRRGMVSEDTFKGWPCRCH